MSAAVINLTGNSGYNSNRNATQKKKKNSNKQRITNFISTLPPLPLKPGDYRIPEIPIGKYFYSIKRLYELIEGEEKQYNTYDDIFAKHIFFSQTGANEDGWRIFYKEFKFQNGLYAKLGDFHEELAGKLPGYRNLPQGHWSGLDVIKDDRTEIYEFKNSTKVTTETLTTVYQKFKTILDNGKIKMCILVCVNVPDGWKKPKPIIHKRDGSVVIDLTGPEYAGRVHIASGREAYAHMSGSGDFFDRLLQTIALTFREKTFKELLNRTSRAMNEA
jgi:hypothetical protein